VVGSSSERRPGGGRQPLATHRLSASQYNARRAQCEAAVAALAVRHPTVRSLRDVDQALLAELADLVDETTARRVRHVVEENERVVAATAALEDGRVAEVGRLMAESHAWLRDLYEVSSASSTPWSRSPGQSRASSARA